MLIAPDGSSLYVASEDGTVTVWDITQAQPKLQTTLRGHNHRLTCLLLAYDGKTLYTGDVTGKLGMWRVGDEQLMEDGCLPILYQAHEGPLDALLLSPDGKTLFSGGSDAQLGVWRVQRRQLTPTYFHAPHQEIRNMAITADGEWLYTVDSRDNFTLWTSHLDDIAA